MSCVLYIANGFNANPSEVGEYYGGTELRFWNPTSFDTTVRMTVYYSDRNPVQLPEFPIKAGGNPLLVYPKDDPEHFKDVGPWGMKLVSDSIIMVDHIGGRGRKGPPEHEKFRGGCNDSLAKDRLSRLWYFSDGLALIWDPDTAPFPFNEFEWYHVLNPNKQDAQVTMKCYYSDGSREDYEYTVKAERVQFIDNYGMVKTNNPFGIRFVSDQPVVAESERFIYGLRGGFNEWGAHLHCPRPGLPAPLTWNEEDVVAADHPSKKSRGGVSRLT
jgi:hypothetical protein